MKSVATAAAAPGQGTAGAGSTAQGVLTPAVWLRQPRPQALWIPVLIGSGLLWLFAQLDGGRLAYQLVSRAGLPLERAAFGAFNWYAWQLVWVAGLWLGFHQHRGEGTGGSRRWLRHPAIAVAAVATCVVFLLWRHRVGGLLAQVGAASPLVDKWRLGPLRVLDCIALGRVLNHTLLPALRWLPVKVLELLGRNSLQVFCAHIPACVLGDALAGPNAAPPDTLAQAMLLALMLGVMLSVAWRAEMVNRQNASLAGRSPVA